MTDQLQYDPAPVHASGASRALPGTPTDRYSPPIDGATCPHCGQAVADVRAPAAVRFALFRFDCPGCGRRWDETRDRDEVGRFYTRARQAQSA